MKMKMQMKLPQTHTHIGRVPKCAPPDATVTCTRARWLLHLFIYTVLQVPSHNFLDQFY